MSFHSIYTDRLAVPLSSSAKNTEKLRPSLSDSNLCLKSTASTSASNLQRTEDFPNKSKYDFDKVVKRYYHQLSVGCQDPACTHKLCASCKNGPKIASEACLVMAVQLATKSSKLLLCPRITAQSIASYPSSPKQIRQTNSATNLSSNLPMNVNSTWNTLGETFGSIINSLGFLNVFASPSSTKLSPPPQREFSDKKNILYQSSDSIHANMSNEALDSTGLFLSLTIIQDLIQKDQTKLLQTIESVFSRSRLLNLSFLDSNATPAHLSGLNIIEVRQSFDLILSLSSDVFFLPFIKSIERITASLNRNILKLYQAPDTELRQLLILLENPVISDPNHNDLSILKNLSLILGNLHGPSKQTMIKWLSRYDQIGFIRILRIFQLYIMQHYHPNNRLDEAQLSALQFMRLLFESNTLSKSKLATTNDFYIEALSSKLNFKEEYKLWKLDSHKRSKTVPTILSVTQAGFSYLNFPFLFDPVAKTRIMHIDAVVQMSHEFEDAFVHQALVIHTQRFLEDSDAALTMEKGLRRAANPFLVLEVRRGGLVEDVLNQLSLKGADLKKPLKVRFIGGGEEGQDQGGVQKEFFQVLVNELLDPAVGMFTYEEETRQVWINGASLEHELQFEIVGMIFALALYNGVILGVSFPKIVYKKLLGEQIGLEDVKLAFPALGKGLQQLLDWEDGDVGDVFMRTFEISYQIYGKVVDYPLMANGADELVTNANRKEYVQKYIFHLTNTFVSKQFGAFRKGFYRVVGGQALHLCNADELELLICGAPPTEFDFKDLENAAMYDDGYSDTHHVIEWFWSIVHAMSFEQKQSLLMFVTASDRIPLKGLGQLTFVVQRNGPDSDRLPTALTCFGRLLLPEYSDYQKLKNRLLTAIENAKGFGLV